jgi:hypothetical protein
VRSIPKGISGLTPMDIFPYNAFVFKLNEKLYDLKLLIFDVGR